MYSIIANTKLQTWMSTNLQAYLKTSTNSNIKNHYIGPTFNITLYTTNNTIITGLDKDLIYQTFIYQSQELNYTGCDEVGVGDFFGPVVYVAVTLDKKSIEYLSTHPVKINDSKKLTSIEINDIYNKLHQHITHQVKIVYDNDIIDNHNSIAQKVYYHHLNTLHNDKIIIDLFTTLNSFKRYSDQLNITWPHLVLETKADSKFISVALASIFSFFFFIKEMNKLNEKYQMTFPYGANNVIPTAQKFIQIYSKEELATFCKTTFKTFNEIT